MIKPKFLQKCKKKICSVMSSILFVTCCNCIFVAAPSYGVGAFESEFTAQETEDGNQPLSFAPQYTYFNYGNQLTSNQVFARGNEQW